MLLKRTVLGLFFVTFCWHFGDGTYLCLLPKSFHAGWPLGLAITVRKVTYNAPVNFQATLVIHNKKVSSITDRPIISGNIEIEVGQTKLLTLQIPHIVPDETEDEIFILNLASTGGLVEKSKHAINFNKNQSVLVSQTDKNIYKPGQNVLFRILNMNKSLQPMFQPLSVFIVNPDGNKLEKFDNLTSSTGVIETSFELSEYATLGTWQIQVINADMDVLHTSLFLVEEFVLPKFSVEVSFDPPFLEWNKYNPLPTVLVKSIYTYGKAVQGECQLKLSRAGISTKQSLSRKIPETGIVEFSDINWISLVGTQPSSSKSVLAQVEVTDETGRKETGSATILVYRSKYKVEILDSSTKVLKQGLQAEFYIRVSEHNGNLVPNKQVQIRVSVSSYTQSLKDIVDTKEMADGEPYIRWTYTPTKLQNLDKYEPTATIKVNLKDDELVSETKKLAIYKSEGDGAIQVIPVGNTIIEKGKPVEFSVRTNVATSLTTLTYMVVSQGNILMAGNIIDQKITLTPTLEMCPEAYLVVHMIQAFQAQEEVVVDYISLAPHMCLDKRVMVSFEAQQVRTGADTNMDVQVERRDGSNNWISGGIHDVYYLAVDKSIVLLQGSTDMNENKVLSSLQALNPFRNYKDRNVESAGISFSHLGLLHNEGQVLVFVPTPIPEPEIVFDAAMPEVEMEMMRKTTNDGEEESEEVKVEEEDTSANVVRKDFPDTWLWGKAETQSNGQLSKLVRLPDTITSWQVSAFAINSDGVAYAGNPFELTGYQPFFLSMNLPYSIKRGEIFKLRITVFNYRQDEVDATVRLKLSEMFVVIDGNNKDGWSEADIKIKASLASSVEFLINATRIGEMELEAVAEDTTDGQRDQVIRKLLVKPQGEEQMEAITNVMVLNDEGPLTKFFQIDWPYDKIVADSQRLQVKITGETMGQALSGLEGLVTMPYGCGEQNMISTVPNIYGLMYIKSTDQKNMEETIEKLRTNMKKGYRREVDQFRHQDGAYSAWGGKSGDKGSTWLTAFVVKSFAQASRYMSVDSQSLTQSVKFILSKQNQNGAFREDGKVLHTNLQTGTGDGLGMTVYVLLSMLEMHDVLGGSDLDGRIQLATSYIISSVGQRNDMDNFLSAMTAYALSLLPSRSSIVEETVDNLLAKVRDSDAPWNDMEEEDKKSTLTTGNKPKAVLLETAAYLLLTYTRRDQNWEALNMMKWIQSKQNAQGGFISTQDTVLVLQSLSEFGRYMGRTSRNGKVTVDVPSVSLKEEVDISGDRGILLQIVDVPASVNLINVTLSGDSKVMAIVKVAYYYYTLVEDDSGSSSKSFANSMDLKTRSWQLTNNVHQVQGCVRSSDVDKAEMYLMSFALPSGEAAVHTPSELLMKNPGSTRVETEEGFIHFYMDTIPEHEVCMQADLASETEFVKKHSGSVKVYSYYAPDKMKQMPLALDSSIVCTSDPCDSAVPLTGLFLSIVICTLISLLMCV